MNPVLYNAFSADEKAKLCTFNTCPSSEGWRARDQMVVTWTIKGKYKGSEFTLLPRDGTNISREQVLDDLDTLIRKKQINSEQEVIF